MTDARRDAYGRPLTPADLAYEAREARIEEEHREGGHVTAHWLTRCQSCAENDSDARYDTQED